MWQDGPRHDRLRGFLATAFSPRVVAQFDHWIREICIRIVREVKMRGNFDAIPQVAAELPAQVVASILGVPEEDRHHILDWATALFGRMDPEIGFAGAARVRGEVVDYVLRLREMKRANPGADMATELLKANHKGSPITDGEYIESALSLLIAGFETTHTLIAQSLLLMATDADARRQVDEGSPKVVIEELLRYVSPVMHMGRTATEDVELNGKIIRQGDFVMLWYTAGNRDPALFDDPHQFNVGRARKGHAAFGAGGPHYCIGSHLAKLEVEILLEEFCKADLRLALDGDWAHAMSVSINAISRMPMKVI
jgi:cholest-4-en-3-one 26-monooxygenase